MQLDLPPWKQEARAGWKGGWRLIVKRAGRPAGLEIGALRAQQLDSRNSTLAPNHFPLAVTDT